MANRSALRSIADAPWSHPRAWPTARACLGIVLVEGHDLEACLLPNGPCEGTAPVGPVLVGLAGPARRRTDVVDEHPAAWLQRLVKGPHERGIVDPEIQEPARIDRLFWMNVSIFESIL